MAIGIIAEYNPFHNGHRYQLEQIKSQTSEGIIAVMSGSFTQRGEPAIIDKFTRAKLAVQGGCDLVIELPFTSAVRSAQDFARGGIKLLSELKVVDKLAFGAETNDIDKLKSIANLIDEKEFKEQLKLNLKRGISYSKAMSETIGEDILKPNNILAIEYLRAMKSTKIEPMLIERTVSAHEDLKLNERISSGSAIRKEVYSKNPNWELIADNVDEETLNELCCADLPQIERLFLPLKMKLITSQAEDLKMIYGINEGLENKFIKSTATSYETFVNEIVSQRYTRSRIQRLILYLMFDLRDMSNERTYARILSFNEKGRQLIKEIKKKSTIPIITKVTNYKEQLRYDIMATDIVEMLKSKPKLKKDFYINLYPIVDCKRP